MNFFRTVYCKDKNNEKSLIVKAKFEAVWGYNRKSSLLYSINLIKNYIVC